MGARLVQLEGGRRVEQFPLGAEELTLGRDPREADFVVMDAERVSRRHAAVRSYRGRHEIEDLGSANGTWLNGEPLPPHRPLPLEPGDRIELAGDVVFVYERTRGGQLFALLTVAALIAAGAGAAWRWWPSVSGSGRQVACSALPQAQAVAAEGLAAWQRQDAALTKQRLQSAAGMLFHAGCLDDIPRSQLMSIAMTRLAVGLPEPVDLLDVFRLSLESTPPPAAGIAQEPIACRLDAVGPEDFEACLEHWVGRVLVGLRQGQSDVPPSFYPIVAQRLRVENGFIRRSFERGRDVVPMMKVELEKANMPPMLHYLSLIESGYQNQAASHAGAVGMWQFIPGTAQRYQLRTRNPDERMDELKATRAAARYLRDLAFEFGGDALLLALAGYNRGENGVRAALRKLEDPFSERSYWVLVERRLLPEETSLYVPRFLAAAVAGEGGLPAPEVVQAYLQGRLANGP